MRMIGMAIFVCILLVGCQTQTTAPPPNRTIEISAPADKIKSAILDKRIPRGYTINSDTTHLLSIDKPSASFATNIVYGSKYDGTPNYRLTYQFIGDDPVKLFVRAEVVTNPGSGFERKTNVTNADEVDMIMVELALIKFTLESDT